MVLPKCIVCTLIRVLFMMIGSSFRSLVTIGSSLDETLFRRLPSCSKEGCKLSRCSATSQRSRTLCPSPNDPGLGRLDLTARIIAGTVFVPELSNDDGKTVKLESSVIEASMAMFVGPL
jgi:hypothetical protein